VTHLDLPPSRGKKNKEMDDIKARDDTFFWLSLRVFPFARGYGGQAAALRETNKVRIIRMN